MKVIGLHLLNCLGLLEEPVRFESVDDALKAIAGYACQDVPQDEFEKINYELDKI